LLVELSLENRRIYEKHRIKDWRYLKNSQ